MVDSRGTRGALSAGGGGPDAPKHHRGGAVLALRRFPRPRSSPALQRPLGSFFGRLFLLGWTFALFYHFCNGIRHLAWDAGWGFGLDQVQRTGLLVVGASAVLTLVVWIAGYWVMGGG